MQEGDNMEEHNQTIWNFDGAELHFIFGIKNNFTTLLDKWDLENAYWSLRLLRREVDAALKRVNKRTNMIEEQVEEEKAKEGRGKKGKETEKEEIDRLMVKTNTARDEYLASKQEDLDKSNFYNALESFYMRLCYLMKVHGMYFREGSDGGLAVFRR